MTGRPVFSGRTRLDLAARHLMEEPRATEREAPEGSVPPELDELILQLLAKDPTRRPASLAVVRRVLEQCVSRLEVEATLPVGTIGTWRQRQSCFWSVQAKTSERSSSRRQLGRPKHGASQQQRSSGPSNRRPTQQSASVWSSVGRGFTTTEPASASEPRPCTGRSGKPSPPMRLSMASTSWS